MPQLTFRWMIMDGLIEQMQAEKEVLEPLKCLSLPILLAAAFEHVLYLRRGVAFQKRLPRHAIDMQPKGDLNQACAPSK